LPHDLLNRVQEIAFGGYLPPCADGEHSSLVA
jgi:hypothetical protein